MFNRFRRLHISLAAKCQILFGSAVALIIAAALFVPWQRMRQLTTQLDQGAASALAENAVVRHMWQHRMTSTAAATGGIEQPTTAPSIGLTTRPVTPAPPRRNGSSAELTVPAARLISITAPRDDPSVTRFQRQALSEFRKEPDRRWFDKYYERTDGSQGYRYAQPLFLTQDCAVCHSSAPQQQAATGLAATQPTVATVTLDFASGATPRPAPTPAEVERAAAAAVDPDPPGQGDDPPRMIGVVAVDIASRIDANQLMLNQVFILAAGLLASTLAF